MKTKVSIEKGESKKCLFNELEDGDYFIYNGCFYVKITESAVRGECGAVFNCLLVRSGTLNYINDDSPVQAVDIDITYRVK